jgi:hypothetical protein
VPDDQYGARVRWLFFELAQDFSILGIVELLCRVGNRQPDELVDLVPGVNSPPVLRAAQ